jgi:peptidoglycan hydrolase CwlO-like protein
MESKFHEEVVNDMQKKIDELKADNYEKQMSLNMLNKKIAGIVY